LKHFANDTNNLINFDIVSNEEACNDANN